MKIIDHTTNRPNYPRGLRPGNVIKVQADMGPSFFLITSGDEEIKPSKGERLAYQTVYKFADLGSGNTEGFGMKFAHGYKSIDEMIKDFVDRGIRVTPVDAETVLRNKRRCKK